MCDEYYDERTKAFWRAMVGDRDLKEEKDEVIERSNLPPLIEPTKAKPKMLVR
jgi:hypothetical protein